MKEQENTSDLKIEPIQLSTTIVGGANRTMIAKTRDHEITMDLPKQRGGDDAGPTPPECLAIALGGCLLNIGRILAMQRQIVLEDFQVTITGEVDPTKAFGIPTEKRAGFSSLSVRLQSSSKLTDTERQELLSDLIDRCPLCDTIGNPTPLEITFDK